MHSIKHEWSSVVVHDEEEKEREKEEKQYLF
jgi:hypothetical protein